VASKLQNQLAYPPRAMRAETAAAYLSMSRAFFLELVNEGLMPKPVRIRGAVTWDRIELDAAYEDLKANRINTVDERLRELRNAKGKGE